jgi:hypothetical protein
VAAAIKLLVALAEIGKWKCGTPKPDLPVSNPDDPTVDKSKSAFVCGRTASIGIQGAQGAGSQTTGRWQL